MSKCLKKKFVPLDYQQNLFRENQNLRKKELSIPAFNKLFFRLQIRIVLQEDDEHATVRYVYALIFQLQDELAFLKVNCVDEAYQLALKAKDKLNR